MVAFRNVAFWYGKVSGISDSSQYLLSNKKVTLFNSPIIWSENTELKGDSMQIFLNDSIIDSALVLGHATALMEVDSGKYYNQVSGKAIHAFFSNEELTKIDVKGNVVLAKYFVYIEVYDFSVSEDEVVKVNGQSKTTQTTRLGLQIKFVDAETSEVLVGSGLGESSTIQTISILDGIDDDGVKFNQSTIGISTKKALETASSRVVTRMIKKGIFKK